MSIFIGASPGGKSALEASMAATLAAISLPIPPPKPGKWLQISVPLQNSNV